MDGLLKNNNSVKANMILLRVPRIFTSKLAGTYSAASFLVVSYPLIEPLRHTNITHSGSDLLVSILYIGRAISETCRSSAL